MATLLMRPAEGGGGSADKKRRARKGKNVQKKQPQRGLGVAQLEKLRLQEQSLLCASPSYSLRLCPTPDHPMARCDSDVSQTILTLANAPHSAGGGCSSPGGMGVSRFGSLGVHSSSTQSLSSVVPDKKLASVESDAKLLGARTLSCLSQPSKFPPANASFFSNVLATTQLQIFDNHMQQTQPLNERRTRETGNAPVYIVPSSNGTLNKETESHVNDAGFKLHPVFKDFQRIPLNLTDPHYFETLIGPDVPHLPRKRIELPVVGASPSIDKTNSTKELSSFQSFPSQQAWSSPDKVSGRKRPWLALQQEHTRQMVHPQALDLNAPAGEDEERQSPRPNQHADNRVGAHYTTGIVRNALGNSFTPLKKITVCSSVSPWQDGDGSSSVAGYLSDMGTHLENGIVLRHCTSQSSMKDGCSNASGVAAFVTSNRARRPNNNETRLQVEKEAVSSNFLTLGISSSYSANGWNESGERDNSCPMQTNDFSRLKHGSSTSGCEGDDTSFQPRKSVCTPQELGVDLEGSKCFTLEYYGGNKRKSQVLPSENAISSCHHNRVFSLPSVVTTADHHSSDHSTKSPRIVEDILDLRLKLAL